MCKRKVYGGTAGAGFTLVELLTVISIICLLMAIMLPVLHGAKASARAGVCQSNLRQWGVVYKMYTDEFDGKPPRDYGEFAWYYSIREYYSKEAEILLCPTAKKAADPDGADSGPPFGGTFLAWGRFAPPNARPAWDTCGSYGLNQWAYKPEHRKKTDEDEGNGPAVTHLVKRMVVIPRRSSSAVEDPNATKDTNPYWDTAYAHNSNNIPLVFDCSWLYARFVEDADPPNKDANSGIDFFGFANPLCMDRHRGGINSVFFDWSVRKVGLKELWTLKWHQKYNTAGPWTRAGGVKPEDWPHWMQRFKDY